MILLYVALAWLAGGAIAATGWGDAWPLVLSAGVAGGTYLAFRRRHAEALVLGIALLALLVSLSRYEAAVPALPAVAVDGEVRLLGEVVSDPETRGEAQSFRVRVGEAVSADERATVLEGGSIRVTRRPYPEYRLGDVVELTGEIQPLSDIDSEGYRRYLERQGVVGVMQYPDIEVVDHRNRPALLEAMASLRHDLGSALERAMPEPEAALAKGMLLGRRDGIPEDVEGRFNDAGISHLIVISGANVMLVAGFVVGCLRSAAGRRYATLLAMAVVVAYAVFVGGSPPVWRATIMALVVLGSVLFGRGDFSRGVASPLHSHGLNALLVAAAIMTLLDPLVIREASFQLSFAATAGIVLYAGRFGSFFDRWLIRLPEGAARFLSGQLAMTSAASIAVIPIIAAYFGRLSLISVPANLVAAPLFIFALGGSALTAVAGAIHSDLGSSVAVLGRLPMTLLVLLADGASSLPLASVRVAFSVEGAAVSYLLMVLALISLLRRRSREEEAPAGRRLRIRAAGWAAVATTGIALGIWWSALTPTSDRLSVTVLDVGQGDAILIETPEGQTVLVDGGPSGAALMQALGEALPSSRRDIDLVVLTHGQDDHVSGLVEVLHRYEVSHVLEGSLRGQTGAYQAWDAAVGEEGAVRHRATPGQRIELGDAYLEVLAPDRTIAGGDLNENSVVMRLVYGDVSFLLTGDLAGLGEAALLDSGLDVGATVLKVGHHGSNSSTTEAFLNAVAPLVAVVSAGEDNPFGHPSPGMRRRLGDVPLFRTDLHGSVRFETDGHSLWVMPEHRDADAGVPVATR